MVEGATLLGRFRDTSRCGRTKVKPFWDASGTLRGALKRGQNTSETSQEHIRNVGWALKKKHFGNVSGALKGRCDEAFQESAGSVREALLVGVRWKCRRSVEGA